MKSIIKITLSLFFVCLIAVGALATVEYITRDQIYQNNQKDIEKALSVLMPDCSYSETTDKNGELIQEFNIQNTDSVVHQVFEAQKDNDTIGYIIVLDTKGYVDKIGLRVGIKADGTVSGIVIGENSETPGLGANISKDSFLNQFNGLNTPLDVNKIDRITGATYSSNYVTQGINTAGAFVEVLKGGLK